MTNSLPSDAKIPVMGARANCACSRDCPQPIREDYGSLQTTNWRARTPLDEGIGIACRSAPFHPDREACR